MTDEAKVEVKNPGIDPCFDAVVEKYGREMFAFVMNAGMAGQATEAVAALAQRLAGGSAISRQNSALLAHAVGVFSDSFNRLSNALVRKEGWTAEQMEECNQAIQLAYAAKIQTADTPKILLH